MIAVSVIKLMVISLAVNDTSRQSILTKTLNKRRLC